MGQDANALPSLPISITVASLSAIELRQTHAGKRLSFWQEPLNGIGSSYVFGLFLIAHAACCKRSPQNIAEGAGQTGFRTGSARRRE